MSCHIDNKSTSISHGVIEEILCHFPYAIFAVSLSLIILSMLYYVKGSGNGVAGSHSLFHSLHFLHLVFSGTGAILMFRKYSHGIFGSIVVGILVPVIFCTLSDAVLPYFGGRLVGLDMTFHWCFVSHLPTVLPFLTVGILNGWAISKHYASRHLFYSATSHFLHIFVSAMASIMYLVSFGFASWNHHMGFVFIFLLLAVMLPCTLSDIVVPVIFASIGNKKVKVQDVSLCCGGLMRDENT